MAENMTGEQYRDLNLQRMKAYLETLLPGLKYTEPDSYRWKHFVETGHVLRKGCCRDAQRPR